MLQLRDRGNRARHTWSVMRRHLLTTRSPDNLLVGHPVGLVGSKPLNSNQGRVAPRCAKFQNQGPEAMFHVLTSYHSTIQFGILEPSAGWDFNRLANRCSVSSAPLPSCARPHGGSHHLCSQKIRNLSNPFGVCVRRKAGRRAVKLLIFETPYYSFGGSWALLAPAEARKWLL